MKFKVTKTTITAIATEDKENGTNVKAGNSMGNFSRKTERMSGMTACFSQLREKFEELKKEEEKDLKTNFKLWITIEKHTLNTKTGEEKYEDLKDIDETRSAGAFDTLEEAIEQMKEIGNQFEGDRRSKENQF